MLDHADQSPGRVAGQPRVTVQRDAVADVFEIRRRSHLRREAGIGRTAQQAVEFLDLAAFALPPHPHALAGVPQPGAMEQVEAVVCAGGITFIERFDPRACSREHGVLTVPVLVPRIRKVGQQRERDAWIPVAECLHFEVVDQRLRSGDRRDDGGHDHHGARRIGHSGAKVEPR